MALPPPITPPAYPNVPNAPGVPPLLRQVGAVQNAIVLARADVANVLALLGILGPQPWGIYLNGAPAVEADNVTMLDFSQEWHVSNAPQEAGAFVSYNKVQYPFDGRVTFTKGGAVPGRLAMLTQIANAANSLSTDYSLVMPEAMFTSVNVVGYAFARSSESQSGVGLLKVDVRIEQIRVTGTAAFSNTVNPTSAAPVNNGTVQTAPITAVQSTPLPPPT